MTHENSARAGTSDLGPGRGPGCDNTNILYLGAEISIKLVEEQEEHVFDEPSAVIIPRECRMAQ